MAREQNNPLDCTTSAHLMFVGLHIAGLVVAKKREVRTYYIFVTSG